MTEKDNKGVILVLPKQFFVDAFSVNRGSAMSDFKEQNHYQFIANVIITVSASFSEYERMAITTNTALTEFDKLISQNHLMLSSREILEILKGTTYIVDDPSINRLNPQESMIAIADKLYVSSNYEPVIVINPSSRDNYKNSFENYYRNGKSQNTNNANFKMYDPRQTKVLLEDVFPDECREVLSRTKAEFQVFD